MTWDDAYRNRAGVRWYPSEALVSFLGSTYDKDQNRFERSALDVGCGTGRNMWLLYEWGFTIAGTEKSHWAIVAARCYLPQRTNLEPERCHIKHATLPAIPFDDVSFDLVIDCQTIQHLNWLEKEHTFLEIWRVLKPGGLFWSMHWCGPAEQAAAVYDGRYPELDLVTRMDWMDVMKECGFAPEMPALWCRNYPGKKAWAEWLVSVARKR